MKYIIILGYNTGEVFYKKLNKSDRKLLNSGMGTFFKHYQLNVDECSWMFTGIKPTLNYLTND